MTQKIFEDIKNNNSPEKRFTLTGKELYDFGRKIAEETTELILNETLITRTQAAEILKVTKQTMTNWENKGILRACSHSGNKYMYRLSEVKKLAGTA